MTEKSVLKIVENCIPGMRRSRQKTLSAAVYGSVRNPSGKLTSMARGMGGSVQLRDRLKRVSRFLGNRSVQMEETGKALLRWLVGRQGPLLPLVVLMDWTEEHDQFVLLFSIKWGKRSIPFYWYSAGKKEFYRSQNSIEYTAIRLIQSWLPKGQKMILVADRGFARSRLFQMLQKLGIDFIVRIPKTTHLISREHRGSLASVGLVEGKIKDVRHAVLGLDAKVPIRMVMKKAKIDGKFTRWFLATSLQGERKESIVSLYERRMGIEATFKDLKTTLGWRFQNAIRDPQRLSRYLLILVTSMICALITAERKSTRLIHRWVSLDKAFRGTEPVSFVQLGLWLIQSTASQLSMIHPRNLPSYAL
jgi:hypothetical protein